MLRIIVFIITVFIPLQLQAESASQSDFSSTLKSKIRMVQHLALNPVLIRALQGRDFTPEPAGNNEIAEADTQSETEVTGESRRVQKEQTPDHLLVLKQFVDRNPAFTDIWLAGNGDQELMSYRSGKDEIDTDLFKQALSQGASQVFVGTLKRDERTRAISTYVSAPVLDRDNNLGVLIVGIRLDSSPSRAVN
jgi:hypothetical protein